MHEAAVRKIATALCGALCVVAWGSSCRRGESEPHAAQLIRHAEETREVLEDHAIRLGHGPTTPAQQQVIRDLRRDAVRIETDAQQAAAVIREGPTARGGGPRVMSAATLRTIANARCEVELSCNAIPSARFATPLACSTALENDGFMGWQRNSCNHGFDGERLDRCLAAIRALPCNARSTVPLQECSPGFICPRH